MSRKRRRRSNSDELGSTSLHTHHFSLQDLNLEPAIEEPITTTVERPSADQRRVYTEVMLAEQLEICDDVAPAAADPDDGNDERYEMFGGDTLPSPKTKKKVPKGKGISKPSMASWRPMRDKIVQELLRHDGTGDARTEKCPGCRGPPAEICCRTCFREELYCMECCVALHARNPLHIVERWDGYCYTRVQLEDLGLRVQMGHSRCVKPQPVPGAFVVLHLNAIQEVAVDFCGCNEEWLHGDAYVQLLRRRWYPATVKWPQTAATFELLDFFHVQTLQAKTTMYDFYVALEKLTNNAGVKPPNRYSEFLRMTRQWRHLLMLKFLYCLFLALNACFRLKRRLISSDQCDPGLGMGWAYFRENEPYRQFLLTVTDQKEMSTCSGLTALNYVNTKFSRGYSSTGVGMGVCARHEFVKPTGVGDLQKGERCA
ncbi:hypothetical protein FB451DRAFT_1385222 [Mycena latifolia]|nr:hypothetical protein FB451DRAFT_1385222 [Mycena latifolia]